MLIAILFSLRAHVTKYLPPLCVMNYLIALGDSCHLLCLTAVLEGEDVVGTDAGGGIRTAQGHNEFTVFFFHLCNRRRRIVGVEGIHVGIGDDGPSEWLSKQ